MFVSMIYKKNVKLHIKDKILYLIYKSIFSSDFICLLVED